MLAACAGIFLASHLISEMLGRSLWFDEVATYWYAAMPLQHFWSAIHHGDAFYALYYLCMHFWIKLFGSSEISLRMPSFLAAIATCVASFFVVRRLGNVKAAYAMCALLAVNVLFYQYASEARPYSAMMLCSVLLTLSLLHAIDAASLRAWSIYGVVAAIALHVHLYLVLIMSAQLVYLFATRRWAALRACAIATALAGCTAVPMLLTAMHDENSQNTWLNRPDRKSIADLFQILSGSWLLLCLDLLCIAYAVQRGLRTRQNDATVLLLCLLVVPIVELVVGGRIRPDYRPPYMLGILPALLYFVSIGIGRARFGAVAGIVIASISAYSALHAPRWVTHDWRRIAQAVRADHAPIAVIPQQGYAVLAYYAPDQLKRVVYPRHFAIEHSEALEPLQHGVPPALPSKAGAFWIVYDVPGNPNPEFPRTVGKTKAALQSHHDEVRQLRDGYPSAVEYRRRP